MSNPPPTTLTQHNSGHLRLSAQMSRSPSAQSQYNNNAAMNVTSKQQQQQQTEEVDLTQKLITKLSKIVSFNIRTFFQPQFDPQHFIAQFTSENDITTVTKIDGININDGINSDDNDLNNFGNNNNNHTTNNLSTPSNQSPQNSTNLQKANTLNIKQNKVVSLQVELCHCIEFIKYYLVEVLNRRHEDLIDITTALNSVSQDVIPAFQKILHSLITRLNLCINLLSTEITTQNTQIKQYYQNEQELSQLHFELYGEDVLFSAYNRSSSDQSNLNSNNNNNMLINNININYQNIYLQQHVQINQQLVGVGWSHELGDILQQSQIQPTTEQPILPSSPIKSTKDLVAKQLQKKEQIQQQQQQSQSVRNPQYDLMKPMLDIVYNNNFTHVIARCGAGDGLQDCLYLPHVLPIYQKVIDPLLNKSQQYAAAMEMIQTHVGKLDTQYQSIKQECQQLKQQHAQLLSSQQQQQQNTSSTHQRAAVQQQQQQRQQQQQLIRTESNSNTTPEAIMGLLNKKTKQLDLLEQKIVQYQEKYKKYDKGYLVISHRLRNIARYFPYGTLVLWDWLYDVDNDVQQQQQQKNNENNTNNHKVVQQLQPQHKWEINKHYLYHSCVLMHYYAVYSIFKKISNIYTKKQQLLSSSSFTNNNQESHQNHHTNTSQYIANINITQHNDEMNELRVIYEYLQKYYKTGLLLDVLPNSFNQAIMVEQQQQQVQGGSNMQQQQQLSLLNNNNNNNNNNDNNIVKTKNDQNPYTTANILYFHTIISLYNLINNCDIFEIYEKYYNVNNNDNNQNKNENSDNNNNQVNVNENDINRDYNALIIQKVNIIMSILFVSPHIGLPLCKSTNNKQQQDTPTIIDNNNNIINPTTTIVDHGNTNKFIHLKENITTNQTTPATKPTTVQSHQLINSIHYIVYFLWFVFMDMIPVINTNNSISNEQQQQTNNNENNDTDNHNSFDLILHTPPTTATSSSQPYNNSTLSSQEVNTLQSGYEEIVYSFETLLDLCDLLILDTHSHALCGISYQEVKSKVLDQLELVSTTDDKEIIKNEEKKQQQQQQQEQQKYIQYSYYKNVYDRINTIQQYIYKSLMSLLHIYVNYIVFVQYNEYINTNKPLPPPTTTTNIQQKEETCHRISSALPKIYRQTIGQLIVKCTHLCQSRTTLPRQKTNNNGLKS